MNANYHDRFDRTVKRLFSETYNLMSVHCRRTLLMIGGKLGSRPMNTRLTWVFVTAVTAQGSGGLVDLKDKVPLRRRSLWKQE